VRRFVLMAGLGCVLAGCGGGGGAANQSLLARLYTGEIGLTQCGAEPCGLQLELSQNLGAVAGTVTVVDVNNRALYRGNFLGTADGSEFGGTVRLNGGLGDLTLDATILSGELTGTWALVSTEGNQGGTLEVFDLSRETIDLRGNWTGFVEFSDDPAFLDAAALFDASANGLASGTAAWVGAGGDEHLDLLAREWLGTTAYRDAATGLTYAARVEAQGTSTLMWLVVFAPDGSWVSFFLQR